MEKSLNYNMKDSRIPLTIALTIFDPLESELDNYFYSFSEIKKLTDNEDFEIQMIILSDNPKLSKEKTDYINKKVSEYSFVEYVPCVKNGLRVKLIFDNINLIRGRYLKTVDPDDFLIPNETVDFVKDVINNINDDKLIIFSYNRVSEEITFKNYRDLNKSFFYKCNSYNPNSAYPMSIMRKVKWNFKLMIWSDDLLGYLLLKEGAEIYEAPDQSFYINRGHAGVSVTKNKHMSNRFFEDSMKFIFISLDNIKNEDDKKLFKSITNKPARWFMYQILNDIFLNELDSNDEKLYKMTVAYSMSKLLVIEEKDLNDISEIYNQFILKLSRKRI